MRECSSIQNHLSHMKEAESRTGQSNPNQLSTHVVVQWHQCGFCWILWGRFGMLISPWGKRTLFPGLGLRPSVTMGQLGPVQALWQPVDTLELFSMWRECLYMETYSVLWSGICSLKWYSRQLVTSGPFRRILSIWTKPQVITNICTSVASMSSPPHPDL